MCESFGGVPELIQGYGMTECHEIEKLLLVALVHSQLILYEELYFLTLGLHAEIFQVNSCIKQLFTLFVFFIEVC